MKALTFCLILLTCFAGTLGCTWFLCLVLHLPPFICPLLSFAVVAVLYRLLQQRTGIPAPVPATRLQWLLMALGIFLIVNRCYHIATIHGGWDAWAMWNHNAKILSDPVHWEQYLVGRNEGHADYPLLLPALNGMLMHFFGGAAHDIAPFTVAMFATLLIPLLLFTALAGRSVAAAAAALFWLATDDTFLFEGSSQYADTLLGLFYLGALVCLNTESKTLKERWVMDALAGFCAGAAAFTKNEGILFLAILAAVYGILLLRKKRILSFVAGLLVPISCLVIFRTGWPAGNDLMAAGSLKSLFNGTSWSAILSGLYALLCHEFLVLQIILAFVMAVAAFRRQWPGKPLLVMLLLLSGYSTIYTLSPYSLDWHLSTSQSRLLHGLQPAMAYAALSWILGPGKDKGLLVNRWSLTTSSSIFSTVRAFLR